MPDNVPQALDEIVLWLDDNLANEEDALFERRAELIEMALRKAMALAAPTPPSVPTAEEQQRDLFKEWWKNSAWCDYKPGDLKRTGKSGRFDNPRIHTAWLAWKFAWEPAHKAGLAAGETKGFRDGWEAASTSRSGELYHALCGIIEIGKRDLTNHKYDGYFARARAALRATPAAPEEPRT